MLTWSVPQEPNGVIIGYEVTYRVNDSSIVTTNTTALSTTFTISSVTPGIRVSNISVSAYTSVGRGNLTLHEDIVTPEHPQPREFSLTDDYVRHVL